MESSRQLGKPTIPTSIIVHLGKPDEACREVSVSFIEYIKNVACSEIYPSWPEAAIRSNVLAQISFALNRIYNEWYESKGYPFDITSHPAYDQTYKHGRDLFDNISKIVDEIFNNYIVKGNHIQPYSAKYCDGKVTLCKGLSQWGTVTLANQGKTPLEILKYYYGNDISIIQDAELIDPIISYPGMPLKLGDISEHIRIIKRQLNRIALNYPALPKFETIHEYYDILTEQVVNKFQEIFDLNVTGIIDKATWYKIKYLYNASKKLYDLHNEGITEEEIETKHDFILKKGDCGSHIQGLHYFLCTIAYFDDSIPFLNVSSTYNDNTEKMVIAFQKAYNLPTNGIIDAKTWNKIKEAYKNTITNLPKNYMKYKDDIYPGKMLSLGMRGDEIKTIQQFLSDLHRKNPHYPQVDVWGCFDTKTETAVKYIQKEAGLEENGGIGPLEWKYIVDKYHEYE